MAEVQKNNPAQAGEMAQRFVQFVMVQAQNILFVLGKIPTPEGDVMPPNLQAAKMLIDQLEMIKIKTQGNLSRQEAKILDDTLANVQLAFVEASGGTPASMMPTRNPGFDLDAMAGPLDGKEDEPSQPKAPASPAAQPAPVAPPPDPAPTPSAEVDEQKKKFFKSYG
jgi:hypothetical protein